MSIGSLVERILVVFVKVASVQYVRKETQICTKRYQVNGPLKKNSVKGRHGCTPHPY